MERQGGGGGGSNISKSYDWICIMVWWWLIPCEIKEYVEGGRGVIRFCSLDVISIYLLAGSRYHYGVMHMEHMFDQAGSGWRHPYGWMGELLRCTGL